MNKAWQKKKAINISKNSTAILVNNVELASLQNYNIARTCVDDLFNKIKKNSETLSHESIGTMMKL